MGRAAQGTSHLAATHEEQHPGYSDGGAALFSQVGGMKQPQGEMLVMRYVKCLFSLQCRECFSDYDVLVPWFPAITSSPKGFCKGQQ